MAIMEISIVPIGTKTTSVSKYVAFAVRVLKQKGLKYKLCPMGTVVEGDVKELFNIAEKIHESIFTTDVKRIVTTIKIDDRRDKKSTMKQKVESVRKKIKK
jgi:uncharacterized protein (TIGR00106 family)